MSHDNPKDLEEKLRTIQAGLAKVLAPGKSMNFRGQMADGTVVNPLVNAALALIEGADTAEIAWHEAVKTRDAGVPGIETLVQDLENGANSTWGDGSPESQALGFQSRKKAAPLSSEKAALKAARARATRQARGTLGPKARKSVKGVVNPVDGSATPGTSITRPPKSGPSSTNQ